jgi:arabinogalactan endo-1,4-beta-galactosidase
MNPRPTETCAPRRAAAAAALCAAFLLRPSAAPAAAPFANGADASWYTQMVHDAGYVFRTQQGVPQPCPNVLQGVGINAVRLRVWLNPAGGWCGQSDVVAKALAANALGQRVMLDFHFSDTWASGTTQAPPAAWQNYDLAQMETAVAGEVTSVLGAIQQAGGSVSWVQLGNEINDGMLFPVGEVGGQGDSSFANLEGLINAGYTAVKAAFPDALVVIHLSNGENKGDFEWFFDNLKGAGGQFDVIGMSAYPFWANLSWQDEVTEAATILADMQSRYGVPTMVCECGYAESDPQDCYSFLSALIPAAKQAGALGVFYWEPECYGNWPSAANGGTYAMGAFTANGEPSKGMNAFADSGVAPYFAPQPAQVTVASGSSAVLSAPASAFPSAAYQWSLNGSPIAGATGPSLLVSGATPADAGTYACTAANSAGSATSAGMALAVASTPDPGRLTNISCRAQVGTGGNIIIAGFVVGGSGTSGDLSVLIRGTGPTLGQSPYDVPAVLPDPQLELYRSNIGGTSTLLQTAGAWGGNALIASTAASVGAFSWPLASLDSAILASLPQSGYTAQVAGKGGDTGVALVEVYDATPAGTYTLASPRLTNLSARVQVGTGANVVFAGFVIGGTTAKTVLIRASGPTLALAPFNLTGTLPDPQLTLTNVGVTPNLVMAINSGWGGDSLTASVAASVGAFPWASSSADCAVLVTLPPGNYTAGVAGAAGDSGLSLVEVYEVP